jgi:hypothetical protein
MDGSNPPRRLGKILAALETNSHAKEALVDFKKLMEEKRDTNSILLVLQKVRKLLFESYDAEYIRIVSELVNEEVLYDAFLRVYYDHSDREDFSTTVVKLWKKNKLPFMKHMREMKSIPLMNEVVVDMEIRYAELLQSLKKSTS